MTQLLISTMTALRAKIRPAALLGALAGALLLLAPAAPFAATDAATPAGSKGFQICENQTYALCATARCFVFDGVSYCKCDVKKGDSISLPFNTKEGNVCDINADGVGNGYMVSTYSLPPSVVKGGDEAIYTCPAETSNGAYAQCDGGICFRSTQGQEFPGLGKVAKGEIVCSCPITTGDPSTAKVGFQIVGPYPCQKSFFKNCQAPKTSDKTGKTIYVGAATGTPRILTKELYGKVPPLNHCE
jgi:hypothetical protein